MPVKPLDFSGLKTYSLFERPSKVSVEDLARPLSPGLSFKEFLACLPKELAAKDLLAVARAMAHAIKNKRPVIWGFGAHVIKVGLTPIIIDLMRRGFISAVMVNGACMVHDSELAMAGITSEDVAQALKDGSFGAAKETGELVNRAAKEGCKQGLGLALGKLLAEGDYPYKDLSLFASAYKLGVPVTVHVAIGTDIVHMHPTADGAAIGEASFYDFKVFCRLVADLEGGVFFLAGSAVLLPEVFLKALTVVRNLGYKVEKFTTVNFDFIRHYRPLTNVVNRPTMTGGKGYHITGHHEILIPLLAGALLEELSHEA
ncbi:hypothetical protein Thein_0868 [Thermodesulfatator indicus DSM 15286]|uniref:Deoxyhypusine synthase n=1 Tax=Thermodesulfatator indicus (strain DSM 15286 / JCM 11887 / CIR29812) TaxID=667014 RepID=F8ACV4_THEID|nr:hypothetical protein [Thermodesulfatator indicus]AEH44745.1 hypothetical protein Thein_0868 [Thermodesulfatator indicus DSM 15286]